VAIGAGLVAVALVATACGDDDDSGASGATTATTAASAASGSDTTGGSPAPTSGGSAATESSAPPSTGTPKAGGTLTIGAYGEMYGLDPVKADPGTLGGSQALAVYDSLMRTDSSGVIKPYLAQSFDPSPDFTTWTLKLRPNVTFTDGTALDADAVVFNINRHLDPANASRARSNISIIKSVQTVDPQTVSFTLASANSAFPALFVDQPGWIASPTAIQKSGADYNSHPVGAGPFMFQSWEPNKELVLVKNPNYWQAGLPYLDSVVFRPIPDPTTRLASARSGDVDLGISIEAPELADAEAAGLSVTKFEGTGGASIYLNVNAIPNIQERQAITMAIDKTALNKISSRGLLKNAAGPFPASSPWYDAATASKWLDLDLDQAKSLMAQAKAADPNLKTSFKLSLSNNPIRVSVAQAIQQMLTQIGITVDIEPLDVSTVTAKYLKQDFEIALGTTLPFTDPVPSFQQVFQTKGQKNYTAYTNPQVDADFVKAASTSDMATRKQVYNEISAQLASDTPVIFYANGITGLYYGKDVHLDDYNGEYKWYSAAMWIG
jgi:peptide/nickel transport system substrate-binding protein